MCEAIRGFCDVTKFAAKLTVSIIAVVFCATTVAGGFMIPDVLDLVWNDK